MDEYLWTASLGSVYFKLFRFVKLYIFTPFRQPFFSYSTFKTPWVNKYELDYELHLGALFLNHGTNYLMLQEHFPLNSLLIYDIYIIKLQPQTPIYFCFDFLWFFKHKDRFTRMWSTSWLFCGAVIFYFGKSDSPVNPRLVLLLVLCGFLLG